MLREILLLLRDVLLAMLRWATGRRDGRWTLTTVIRAPREVVWSVASSRDITFPGEPPITITETPSPRPGQIAMIEVRSGKLAYKTAFRILETREGEGELYEIVRELSDEMPARSGITRTGYGLRDVPGGTEMTTVHEGSDVPFVTRLNTPIGMRLMARRIEAECYRRTGASPPATSGATGSLALAALSFAAAWAMFGPLEAALLMGILLLHELGHVAAMWLVGLPVKGIYFVPFIGAVSMSAGRERSDLESGFIALMGPLMSLAPTLLLLAVHLNGGPVLAGAAALVAALLNLFNLLPVLPLDGGHVARVALRAVHPSVARAFGWIGLIAGIALAAATGSYLLGFIIGLGALSLQKPAADDSELPPMSRRAALALALCFILAFVAYAWVISRTVGDSAIGDLLWPTGSGTDGPRSPA